MLGNLSMQTEIILNRYHGRFRTQSLNHSRIVSPYLKRTSLLETMKTQHNALCCAPMPMMKNKHNPNVRNYTSFCSVQLTVYWSKIAHCSYLRLSTLGNFFFFWMQSVIAAFILCISSSESRTQDITFVSSMLIKFRGNVRVPWVPNLDIDERSDIRLCIFSMSIWKSLLASCEISAIVLIVVVTESRAWYSAESNTFLIAAVLVRSCLRRCASTWASNFFRRTRMSDPRRAPWSWSIVAITWNTRSVVELTIRWMHPQVNTSESP